MSRLAAVKPFIYLGVSVALIVLATMFFMWSVGYLERAMIATGLLSALIGFSLLSGGLYALRVSAYVYGAEKGAEEGGEA
ncbi:MAG: hypothetical protein DRO39_06585 [Thermoprotei archaeon]|nr:MAG: hypothetical protein DRO39_06585 [Thermoprotei archaeon]